MCRKYTKGIFEACSGKLGVVMLILGVMHFFNLYILTRTRKRATWEKMGPPVEATGTITR
jgi:hypothetical protein